MASRPDPFSAIPDPGASRGPSIQDALRRRRNPFQEIPDPSDESSDEPSIGSRALHAVGSVVGAPKMAIDALARAGARAQGINVGDEQTTGSMLRTAAGLNVAQDADMGYGERLGGRALEFVGDIATDPVTYALGGLGSTVRGGRTAAGVLETAGEAVTPEIATALQRAVRAGKIAAPVKAAADVFFPVSMGVGAIEEGKLAADTIQREGFTPRAAEEVLGTGLSAGMAGLAVAGHAAERNALKEALARRKAVEEARAEPPSTIAIEAPDLGEPPPAAPAATTMRVDPFERIPDPESTSVLEPVRQPEVGETAQQRLERLVEERRQRLAQKVAEEEARKASAAPAPEPAPSTQVEAAAVPTAEATGAAGSPEATTLPQFAVRPKTALEEAYKPAEVARSIWRKERSGVDPREAIRDLDALPEENRSEAAERLVALRGGQSFVESAARRFGDQGPDGVTQYEHDGDLWFVQRDKNKVVGAGKGVPGGQRDMVAGGRALDSPRSVKELYEAMDKAGIEPSSVLSPYGEGAQRIHAERTAERLAREREAAARERAEPAPQGGVREPDLAGGGAPLAQPEGQGFPPAVSAQHPAAVAPPRFATRPVEPQSIEERYADVQEEQRQRKGQLFEHPLVPRDEPASPRRGLEEVWADVNNRTAQRFGPPPKKYASVDEMEKRFLSIAREEMSHRMAQIESGADWYKADIADLEHAAGRAMPELQDPSKKTLFKAVMAVSSFGNDPNMNLDIATRIWDRYQQTGRFPRMQAGDKLHWPGTARWDIMAPMLEKLVDQFGEKGAADWLNETHTVKELNEFKGGKGTPVSGKMMDRKPGFFILGPKGGPFALNLSGKTEHLTADMWLSRTWNRRLGLNFADAPRNDAERAAQKRVWAKLGKEFGLDTAQAQAVDWYYERDLWNKLGVPERGGSYSQAARLALEGRAGRLGEDTRGRFEPMRGAGLPKGPATVAAEAEPSETLTGSGIERSLAGLPLEKRAEITRKVIDAAVERVASYVGVKIINRTHGIGGWGTNANPNALLEIHGTREQKLDAAHMLGLLLRQDSVVMSTASKDGAHYYDVSLKGYDLSDPQAVAKLWTEAAKNPALKDRGMSVIASKDGLRLRTFLDDAPPSGDMLTAIGRAYGDAAERLTGKEIDTEGVTGRATVDWISNDWKAEQGGQAYRSRLQDRGYGRLDAFDAELRELWDQELERARPAAGAAPAALAATEPAPAEVAEPGEPGPARFAISPARARDIDIETKLPDHEAFAAAAKNVGAEITEDGLLIDLVRRQTPDQVGAESVRTGVFYLPKGSKSAGQYTGRSGYGGSEKYEGQTLLRRPLFAKGATGGQAVISAYDSIHGSGAYDRMRSDVLNNTTSARLGGGREQVGAISALLRKYDADPELAGYLQYHSTKGNQLAYAIQENIAAHAVRKAGFDSVLGWSKTRDGKPFISEVFDVRESHYPIPGEEGELHPQFLGSRGRFSTAPVFYSQLQRVAEKIPQAMSGADMARYLKDPKRGVKADELKWTGLDDFLGERVKQRVTPQEVQEFLKQNEVRVEEVERGKPEPVKIVSVKTPDGRRYALEREDGTRITDDSGRLATWSNLAGAEAAEAHHGGGGQKMTKFSQYQLPGGENYRELLLTLPEKKAQPLDTTGWTVTQEGPTTFGGQRTVTVRDANGEWLGARSGFRGTDAEAIADFAKDRATSAAERGKFTGGHFEEPNVLAHVRFNDRTDAQGKRVLFIEELQSDWAQRGRREGFSSGPEGSERIAEAEANVAKLKAERDRLEAEYHADGRVPGTSFSRVRTPEVVEAFIAARSAYDQAVSNLRLMKRGKEGTPQAPFVGSTEKWTELAMKRMLRYAAEHGYDRVAWTTGEQQVKRYEESLRNAVDRIEWTKTKDGVHLKGFKDGEEIVDTTERENAVSDAIGKSMADKIRETPDQSGAFEGDDITISDTGMAGFYDQIVPQVAGKIGKKWGARVGEASLDIGRDLGERSTYVGPEVPIEEVRRRVNDRGNGWPVDLVQQGRQVIATMRDGMSFSHSILAHGSQALAERLGAGKIKLPPKRSAKTMALDITPQMRRSVVEEGQPLFKPEAVEGEKPVGEAEIRKVFPRGEITPAGDGAWTILHEGARPLQVRIEKDGISFRPEDLEPGHGADVRAAVEAGTERVAGVYQNLKSSELIRLDPESGESVLLHEAAHAAKARRTPEQASVLQRARAALGFAKLGALTEKERDQMYRYYEPIAQKAAGEEWNKLTAQERRDRVEEFEADGYAQWFKNRRTANSWFSKILAFVKRAIGVFRPTWESAQERIATGEALEAATPELGKRFSTTPQEPPGATPTPNQRRAGGIEEAMAGEGGATEGKPPDLPFNLDRLNIPAEEKAAFSRVVEAQGERIKEAQGKKTFDEILTEAKRELGIKSDAELQRAMKDGMLGDASTGVAARIRLQELRQQAEAQAALARDNGSPEAQEKAQASALKYANFMLAAKGMQSETARALAAYRILVEPRSESEILISRLLKQRGGITAEQTAKIIRAATEKPETLADTVQEVLAPSLKDKALELWKAGLLSGLPTHGANFIGNVLKQGLTLAETAFTAHVTEPLLAKREGRAVERFSGEAAASWAAIRAKAPTAMKEFVGDLKNIFTLGDEKLDVHGQEKLEYQVGAISGKKGRAARIPFRLLEAADSFFKKLAREQELYKQALRRANREGGAGGVTERAQSFIEQYESLSREQRAAQYPEITKAIDQAGLRETFQDKGDQRRFVDAITQNVLNAKRTIPALHMLVPFARTPGRIVGATLERTPWGFTYLRQARADYLAGKISAGEFSEAVTKPVLGTMLMSVFGAAAQAGLMTGSGPTDPKDQQALKATGWQPYSFVVENDDGSKTYIPFSRFQPVSSLLGMAADFVETANQKQSGDMISKAGASFLNNIQGGLPALTGIENAALLLSDPKRYASQFTTQLAGSAVPAIVARTAQAIDPTQRDTRGEEAGLAGLPQAIGRTLKSRIPGLSQTLPERRMSTGESAQRQGSPLARFASPSIPTTQAPRPVAQELVDIDAVPSNPSREVTIPGTGGKKLRMNDEEFKLILDAREKVSVRVERALRSPGFKAIDPEKQKRIIDSMYREATNDARDKLIPRLKRRLRSERV